LGVPLILLAFGAAIRARFEIARLLTLLLIMPTLSWLFRAVLW
jgi:hypothetical protein